MLTTRSRKDPRARSRAQIIVIFAMSIIAFVGLCAVVIDVSWYWANTLRMQRAADAAALAGVVWLPGNVTQATTVARAESAKNGYTNLAGTTKVTPTQDPTNSRRLKVRIEGDVGTFFARVLGVSQWHAVVDSKAEYVLPVPMGSPENYYGVFGKIRHPGGGWTEYITTTTTDTLTGDTGWRPASARKGGDNSNWAGHGNVYSSDNNRATASGSASNNQAQAWGNFGFSFPGTLSSIDGIEVGVEGRRTGSGNASNCQFNFDLSYNNGSNYTTGSGLKNTGALPSSEPSSPYIQLGANNNLWNRTWTASQMNDTNFRIRATVIKPSTSVCANAISHEIDYLRVRVTYRYTVTTTTTTSVFHPDVNVASPYGGALNPRGFWGVMLTQGAENINGDAYMPFYDTRTSTTNPAYGAANYYDYAVEIPAGGSAGEIWIFDPGFCAVQSDMGTGDRYFGNTNTDGQNEISAYYRVYDTKNTLYDTSDDGAAVASSGTFFANMSGADRTLMDTPQGPPGNNFSMNNLTDCSEAAIGSNTSSPFYYHNRWYQLASGLAGSKTYRIRVSSTDPANINAQKNMNGQNSFAIWTKATGVTPKVHGLGAMEAYTPLEPSANAEFYLAQIEAAHAGKTMEIKLWDPGDTNTLSANLNIRIPTATGYSNASLNYTAAKGTTNSGASNCNSQSGTGVTSITTNTGSSQVFNGCWVTILIPIPTTYTAPTPPGETEGGWWKIRYNMGTGSSSAYDLTTWQVEIRGNPVHLILP